MGARSARAAVLTLLLAWGCHSSSLDRAGEDAIGLFQRGVKTSIAEAPVRSRHRHGSKVCPEGYKALVGDVGGWDQFGREMSNLKDTMSQCAEDCSDRLACGSFEYSTRTKICSLNKEAEPTMARFEDYTFCQKVAVAATPPADAGILGTSSGGQDAKFGLTLGSYKVIWEKVPVNLAPERNSKVVDILDVGAEVKVVEIMDPLVDGRVRARIESPSGWISLFYPQYGVHFAVMKS
mmetsp:Transcript_1014/g.3141  ORF Transcript_1014/g.3141 Transcript_1014/m.3141 type:complete len:236 (+) Transcript_1014:59-766(+)